jgi:hypothetical protein
MRKALGWIGGPIVATICVTTLSPLAASADVVGRVPARTAVRTLTSQTFKNQATGHCMDDSSNGWRAVGCNGTSHQAFDVKAWSDGTRELRNVYTGRCVDDSSNGFRTHACNQSIWQSWTVKNWGDGTIRFQNQGTGRCIEDGGSGFRTASCNDSQNESWS